MYKIMAINLQKGQRISISLSKLSVGLGWDANVDTGNPYDLDASAFMVDKNRQIPEEGFFVFYNNLESPDKAVISSGDDQTGDNSDEGDDETLFVDLYRIDTRIEEIIFTVTIHDYETRKQNFGQIHNSYIRICNTVTNEEIAKYELDEDFSVETSVEFGRLYKKNGEWKFEAIGCGYRDGLEGFVEKYAKDYI